MEITRSQAVDIVRQIGEKNLYAFSVMWLMSHDGICSLKQDELAGHLGISVSTLYRRITELSKPFEGVGPLVTVERLHDMCVYRLAPITIGHGLTIGHAPLLKDIKDFKDPEVQDLKMEKPVKRERSVRKPKDKHAQPHMIVWKHWLTSYHRQFDRTFVSGNYGREVGQIKLLLEKYGGDVDRVKAIIDTVCRLYNAKWATPQFTRPTIGQLVSWLAAQAEPFVQAAETAEVTIETEDGADLFGVHDGRFGL